MKHLIKDIELVAYLEGTLSKEEVRQLKNKLKDNFSCYDDLTLEKLTKGVIADWILRCPINFE